MRAIAIACVLLSGCAGARVGGGDHARVRGRHDAVALCGGLPIDAVERTLADDPDRVIAARPITELGGRPRRFLTVGAELELHLDVEVEHARLEDVFACHAARYQAGLAVESAARDPLGIAGVEVRARVASGRVWLSLRAPDDRRGAELARRALALVD